MSSSQHPIALSIERRVGDSERLLATVMLLPLVDGIFPALVLAGALGTISGILEVGLLVFGGSATVAVILAEMDQSRREQVRVIGLVGVALIALAVLSAALAPTFDAVLNLWIFERFAGLVILAIAARTASSRLVSYIPRPAVIVVLGLVASLDIGGAALVVSLDPDLMLRAAAAGGVGVGFALLVALAGPWLRNAVEIDRFRFGSAVALGVLALSIFGLVPGDAPLALAVLGVSALLAFDPGRARMPESDYHPDHIDVTAAMADGGSTSGIEDSTADAADEVEDSPTSGQPSPGDVLEEDRWTERAPWL